MGEYNNGERINHRSTGRTGTVWIQEPDGWVWILYDDGYIEGADAIDLEKIAPTQRLA